jgi:adenylate kinase family enzyme
MKCENFMEKIVIMGSSGAGKTTLARELGPILKIKKVIHLDRLYWQRGWKGKTRDTRIDIIQDLVREKQWIIDGNYFSVSELHLNAADTIIFLNPPPLVCLQRLIKRHRKYCGRSRRDIPEGCTDKLTRLRMLKVLVFPLQGRRRLEEELRKYNSKQIVQLHSDKEVEEFLAQQKRFADDMMASPATDLDAEERTLVPARR